MRYDDVQTQQPTLFTMDIGTSHQPTSTPIDVAQSHRPRGQHRVVPMSSLRISPHHPRRRDGEHLAQLAASIGASGMLQPPLVRPLAGRRVSYEVIVGARRVEAARQLGQTAIDVCITDVNDVDVLILALVDDLHHQHITAEDKMDAYVALVDILGTQAAVAERLGISKAEVCKVMRVARHPAARAAVCDDRIKLDHAYDILAAYPAHEVDDILARAAASGHTQQQSRARIKAIKGGEKGRGVDVTLTSLETNLTTAVARDRTATATTNPKMTVVSGRNGPPTHDKATGDVLLFADAMDVSTRADAQQQTVDADDLAVMRLYHDTDRADLADVWHALKADLVMIEACLHSGPGLITDNKAL